MKQAVRFIWTEQVGRRFRNQRLKEELLSFLLDGDVLPTIILLMAMALWVGWKLWS